MKTRSHSEIRCLKIDEKWINLILNGSKTWEIRRTNTKIRERIALGDKETRQVVGYAKIADSRKMTVEDLKKHNDKHRANDFIDTYSGGKAALFAWFLADIEVESNPKPYTYSTGSWCRTKK
jgi:hypothetical protein